MRGKLIVVKIGTSSLVGRDGGLDLKEMEKFVRQVASVVRAGNRAVLVTSGAIASGNKELGVRPNPSDLVSQQTSAAAGQGILMSNYRDFFKKRGLKVAQVLLTQEDLSSRVSYLHICSVLDSLLKLGVIPIVNENDVTSVDEIIPVMKGGTVNFSDNDVLSALIANAVRADLLVILSDVDGLYTANPDNPKAELIHVVKGAVAEFAEVAEGKGKLGRGGMKTKLKAAEIVTSSGIPMLIANGRREGVLEDIIRGKRIGTFFETVKRMPSRKRWIAYGASVRGSLTVNEGAKAAILKGASLLPVGVTGVSGSFGVGDVVSISDRSGAEFARGIANYTSEEVNRIKGAGTKQVERLLGYVRKKELIGRKYMHLREEKA